MLSDISKKIKALKRAMSTEPQVKVYRVGDLIDTLDDSRASKDDKQLAIMLINKAARESNK